MSHSSAKSDKLNYINKPKFKKRSKNKYFYKDPLQYYNNYQPHWNLFPWRRPYRRRSTPEKEPQRSPSPFSGTEEYTLKKIQETSDMIKKQLMMPLVDTNNQEKTTPVVSVAETTESLNETKRCDNERNIVKNKKPVQYNVEEIHHKIITHITNLNHGKKVNLICATSSGYDVAIQQIQKQKRLELSKAFRDMCANQTVDNSDAINSIIPDIGIKIEELPLEVIQELSSTLDLNFEQTFCQNNDTDKLSSTLDLNFEQTYCQNTETDNVTIKTEVCDNVEFATPLSDNVVKEEHDLFYEDPMDIEYSDFSQIKSESENKKCSVTDTQTSQTESIDCHPNQSDFSQIEQQIENRKCSVTDTQTSQNESLKCCSKEHSNFSQLKQECENKKTFATNTETSQTESIECHSHSTQTDSEDKFQVNTKVKNLDEAVKAMLAVDNEIARLTKLRQTIFLELQSLNNENDVKKNLKTTKAKIKTSETKKTKGGTIVLNNEKGIKKKNLKTTKVNIKTSETKKTKSGSIALNNEKGIKKKKVKTTKVKIKTPESQKAKSGSIAPKETNFYKSVLNFEGISEKFLTMTVAETKGILLAGCESGKIFSINLTDGAILNTINVGPYPITSLGLWSAKKNVHFFVGSFETCVREYDLESTNLVRLSHTEESVQCMEFAWDFIFIGTTNGWLMRHSLKVHKIEFRDKISQDRVLVLKATQEGARKVLLVGTKNSPVCIRDAMSGLHMRTMNEIVTPTVYSLLLDESLVYCGTTFHDVLVFSFHDGTLIRKYVAGNSKGIGCMKIVDNLLYTSCHNGNIYVYNMRTKQYVGQIDGPGGVILSMAVYKNIIIIGTMSLHFKSVLIPEYILESNKSAFE